MKYCTTCGWLPENYNDEEMAVVGCKCPSCDVGPIRESEEEDELISRD